MSTENDSTASNETSEFPGSIPVEPSASSDGHDQLEETNKAEELNDSEDADTTAKQVEELNLNVSLLIYFFFSLFFFFFFFYSSSIQLIPRLFLIFIVIINLFFC